MKRLVIRILALSCLAISFGVVTDIKTPVDASAKTHAAKVVKREKLKRTSYHANGGKLYTSTSLNKRSAKQVKSIKTTLFATKMARIKKSNGKQATYYFVKNKRGNVKGWLWKGNLNRTKNLAQRASDIRKFKATFPLIHNEDGMVNDALKKMTLSHAYNTSDDVNKAGIPSILMAVYDSGTSKKAKVSFKVYNIFKGRFSHKTNAKLSKLKKSVQREMVGYDCDPEFGSAASEFLELASHRFNHALGQAIHGLD